MVGNPNTGKSTLFNVLTGLAQKTGNFAGVTVEKKTGHFTVQDQKIKVIDLPGVYSLKSTSQDELIALNYIEQLPENELVVVVADATNLKRNLLLASQVIDLGKPVLLALNMMDLLQQSGKKIDIDQLSRSLGVPVVPINARIGKGVEALKAAIMDYDSPKTVFLNNKVSEAVEEVATRYHKIDAIIAQCVQVSGQNKVNAFTQKIDTIVTHRFYGYVLFLSILFLIFQAIFSWSSIPMDLIEEGFAALGGYLQTTLPKGVFNDLVVNGIVAGLGGIVIFVPQIAILFAFITILEDTGYMARVSFLMDRILRPFGMNGKSIIPLISSSACAVPAIMGARTIGNYRERLITIMVAPLISCSARIPVYTILIALIVPADSSWGILNLQGILMMGLYLLGFLAAICSAWVMKVILKNKEQRSFLLEMPVYRMPQWKDVVMTMYTKTSAFLVDAGKIIIAISIVLWALSSYGPGTTFADIDKKYEESSNINADLSPALLKAQIASEKLEASYAGMLGKSIEPAIAPLGFDWKIGIALITSFAAREVFVGTMATLYSIGDEENTTSLREKMHAARHAKTGEKIYSKATTLSLLLFYAFAMQCMATLAIVYKETKSIRWPLIQVVYMGTLAYLSSLLVYQMFS